jgi:hypothetical protein
MKARFHTMICIVLVLVLSQNTACGLTVGPNEQAAKLIQEAINEMGPSNWSSELSKLSQNVSGDAKSVIVTLQEQMSKFSQNLIINAGIEGRCDDEFISQRVVAALQQVLDHLKNDEQPSYTLSPWVCHKLPEEITIDQNGKSSAALVRIIGFGFTTSIADNAKISIMDSSGNKKLDFPYHPAYETPYKISVDLQGIRFPVEDQNKLVVTWQGVDDDRTDTWIFVTTPPPQPVQYSVPFQWDGGASRHEVGYDNSHKPKTEENRLTGWCPKGTFATKLALTDSIPQDLLPNFWGMNLPVVQSIYCAYLKRSDGKFDDDWNMPGWYDVGYVKSRKDMGPWCPNGSFIIGLDLDSPDGASEERPFVAKAYCGYPSDPELRQWDENSFTRTKVWYDNSFHPEMISSWCPKDGTFLVQLILDIGGDNLTKQPFVGYAICASPAYSSP